MTTADMFGYFKGEFGLSMHEVTALLGAHSLGSASKENSGYEGPWNPINSHSFSNTYYRMMIDPKMSWRQVVSKSTLFKLYSIDLLAVSGFIELVLKKSKGHRSIFD